MHVWMANRFLLGEQLFRDRGQAQTWREKKVPGSMSNVHLDVVEVEKVFVPTPMSLDRPQALLPGWTLV